MSYPLPLLLPGEEAYVPPPSRATISTAGTPQLRSGYASSRGSNNRLVLENEKCVQEIDRMIMQSHNLRGKILSHTVEVLSKYEQENETFNRELSQLPDSLEKWEKLQIKKRNQRRIKREIEAAVNESVTTSPCQPTEGLDHSLNFHLAKHNAHYHPSSNGLSTGLDGDISIGSECLEGDSHHHPPHPADAPLPPAFSFYAPPPPSATAAAAGGARYAPPRSRRARKLFNSAPKNNQPPSTALPPSEPSEIERRYKCRSVLFELLDHAHQAEERVQELLQETEKSVVGAPDDASRLAADREWTRLQHELELIRKRSSEALEDLYDAYQPRVPSGKECGALRRLERELRLPRLEDVYKEVSEVLAELVKEDAKRDEELESLYAEESKREEEGGRHRRRSSVGERMEFRGDGQEGYEHFEYDPEEEEEENEGDEEEEEAGCENEYERDGLGHHQQQHHHAIVKREEASRGQSRPGTTAGGGGRGKRGEGGAISGSHHHIAAVRGHHPLHIAEENVMVVTPRHLDKGASDPTALVGLADPSSRTVIQQLKINRPVTNEGQGIERGVKGRIADNTRPIDTFLAATEIYNRKEMDHAPYYMPGFSPPHVALRGKAKKKSKKVEKQQQRQHQEEEEEVREDKTPHWLEARREQQRSSKGQSPSVEATTRPLEAKPTEEATAGPTEPSSTAVDQPSSLSGIPRRLMSTAQGSSSSVTSTSSIDSNGSSTYNRSRLRRNTVLTRGTKLEGRNVLVRIYRNDGDEGNEQITLAAFDPTEQATLEYDIGEEEFRAVFGQIEGRIDDETIRDKAEELLSHLKIVPRRDGNGTKSSSKTLDLDLGSSQQH